MASVSPPAPAAPPPTSTSSARRPDTDVWRAPLVPVALAATAGIVLDRYLSVPWAASLVALVVALFGWFLLRRRTGGLRLIYLWAATAAVAALYHHHYYNSYAADDIGRFATADPQPVKLRGVLDEEPIAIRQPGDDPLRSIARLDATRAVLRCTAVMQRDDWQSASGCARLEITGLRPDLHVGDEVEVAGRLVEPQPAMNPGEADYAGYLRDQRIRAIVAVRKTPAGVTRLSEGWPWSFSGWLAMVRHTGQRALQELLPPENSGVATALLLGEDAAMSGADWERYIRTGVIHVLAISGQHLVVLAAGLWFVLRILGVRRRRGAWVVMLFLVGYAFLTGNQPPVLRSAVMVCVYGIGLQLRRPPLLANSFALGWLAVAAVNPTDLFTPGCQLSILAVAILYWGTSRWLRREYDPLQRLIDEARPTWQKVARWLGRQVTVSYAITFAVWLAAVPLVAARYHLVSPAGLLIGPPVVFLTSIALVSGFLLLFASLVGGPLVPVLSVVTRWSLSGCDAIVNAAQQLPGAYWYVGEIPVWWLVVFYGVLLAVLTHETLLKRWRWTLPAGAAWVCVGLLTGSSGPTSLEVRCTFLAVGHGGCTVIETPDGRTLLYDAGALGGPDVTRRQIAPFLWSRGVRRIDEVFLSHADLDHFNGVPSLLDRFAVGQVTCTPSFADKRERGVQATVDLLHQRGIPVRIAKAGDRLSAGGLDIDVWHPPAVGPPGNENTRSLVLLLRHAGHTILLTGDLEGKGLERVLALPPPAVDVLMAPHHGSPLVNTPDLAEWARPRLVISCQGPPRGPRRQEDPYTARQIPLLGTWPHGAITVHSSPDGLVVETYQTRQWFQVR